MDNLTEEKLHTLFSAVDRVLAEKARLILAIDGPCTAGKTTLAGILEKRYHCMVFHMDEFFLRPEQRTSQRLAQPGGNVDYERFREEVLLPLSAGNPFSYRPFSCREQALTAPVSVPPSRLTVVEGTYALHPYFQEPYDLKVFLTIDPELQRQRIHLRPQWKQERFFREWIPMEQQYFDAFPIRQHCDLIL